MSTSVIVGGVGAAVGFVVGGPQGAMWGWTLGSALGNAIDPPVIRGPSLGDMAQQTTQEGVPIPIVYGLSPPIAGNVMCTSPVRIVKKKSGGKGGPKVETETAFRTYAVQFCEGPIGGFLRVWRNNVKVYDALDEEFMTEGFIPFDGPGIFDFRWESKNEFFLRKARFFLGSYDQDASEDLEAVFGAGTTPAHRGIAYMVIVDEDVTDMRGAIPQWTVQVSPLGSHYESPRLWPWVSGAVPDPRHPLNEYIYTTAVASKPEGGVNQGSTGGTTRCSGIGGTILENGSYSSLDDCIAALNEAWGGDREYNATPYAYSSLANVNLSDKYSHPPTDDYDPEEEPTPYQRWVWLHHAVKNVSPNVILSDATDTTSYDALSNGSLIAMLGRGAVWDDWPRSYIVQKGSSTLGGIWQFRSVSIGGGGARGPHCSNSGDRAYATAGIRAERRPGKPTSTAIKEAGTFRVLRAFSNTSGSGSGNPQAMPLGPCRRSDDPLYNNRSYWEDAYAKAVANGDIGAGLVYGIDFPQVISAAYRVPGPYEGYIFPNVTDGAVSQTVSTQLYLSGADNATWEVSEGQLPTGWSLDQNTGLITGAATTEDDYTFTIRARGLGNYRLVTAEKAYTVSIKRRPLIAGITATQVGVTSTRTINTGSPSAGDMLLIVLGFSSGGFGTSISPPSGGTLSGPYSQSGAGYTYVWRKVCDGSEGTTLNFTGTPTSGNNSCNAYAIIIKAGTYDASRFSIANAGSSSASAVNPPSCTASWGSAANLWIATCGYLTNANATTGFPLSDNNLYQYQLSGTSTHNNHAICSQHIETDTIDPSNFTGMGNVTWRAQTIVIGPVS